MSIKPENGERDVNKDTHVEKGSVMTPELALSLMLSSNQWLREQVGASKTCTCGLCYLCAYQFTKDAFELMKPVDVVLFCPKCKAQHIDAPEPQCGSHVFEMYCRRPKHHTGPCSTADERAAWENPPHKSHMCHNCGIIWRPADVPTNGVAIARTVGDKDTKDFGINPNE